MNDSEGARVSIAGIAGTDLDLGWLQGLRIPAGVHLEVADVGPRVDLVVSRGDEHVALVVDSRSGQILAEERHSEAEDLVCLAHAIAVGRRAQVTPGLGSEEPELPASRILFERVNWPFESGQP